MSEPRDELLLAELTQAMKDLRLALIEQTRLLSRLPAILDELTRVPPEDPDSLK